MNKITMRDENNNKNAIFAQKHQIRVKIGWIGCAIQQATSKRLPGFFFRFNILIFIYFFKYKTTETHAPAFLPLNISAVGSVYKSSDELSLVFQYTIIHIHILLLQDDCMCTFLTIAIIKVNKLFNLKQNVLCNLKIHMLFTKKFRLFSFFKNFNPWFIPERERKKE